MDVLGAKCRFVLDKFHLKQYVTRATSHLEEKAAYVRSCIEDEINLEDQDGLLQMELIKHKSAFGSQDIHTFFDP